jgi:hypothetical protein
MSPTSDMRVQTSTTSCTPQKNVPSTVRKNAFLYNNILCCSGWKPKETKSKNIGFTQAIVTEVTDGPAKISLDKNNSTYPHIEVTANTTANYQVGVIKINNKVYVNKNGQSYVGCSPRN